MGRINCHIFCVAAAIRQAAQLVANSPQRLFCPDRNHFAGHFQTQQVRRAFWRWVMTAPAAPDQGRLRQPRRLLLKFRDPAKQAAGGVADCRTSGPPGSRISTTAH